MELSNNEISRYSRHLIMPEVGLEGQKKLKQAKVLCIGAGGLGSPLALYLAAAGIGKIGILDFDVVDFSNLQRQVIHSEKTIGELKVESAKNRLHELNSDIEIQTYTERFTSDNAMDIVKDYDIVVDGTDNFATRYLTNDVCVLLGKPNVYGSIFRFEGQVSVFDSISGPCYRCLYPEPPPPGLVPSCAEGGVLGILPGVIGTLQASEVVKLIIEQGKPLIGKLLFLDVLEMEPRILTLRKNPECPICSDKPTITGLIDYEEFCGIGRGELGQEQVAEQQPLNVKEISVEEFRERKSKDDNLVLIDVREPHEYEICNIEDSHLIPLNEIEDRSNELNPENEIVLLCHHGGRSRRAANILREKGFNNVKNLKGGIDEWAEKLDPDMARY
ncbi:MAG: molybdopterin-synthase adenylyltransferase MoeB [Candidatus Dadabacteria bacterium]|nr:molybdopterin-synthase adenylyltransferase MoeB [Candidatus Dadabacteria bacterium]NIQ16677.1 molybdopterin-synthase adenylyltransferase MoeB [Candidatus Dadabacteria bacterium]